MATPGQVGSRDTERTITSVGVVLLAGGLALFFTQPFSASFAGACVLMVLGAFALGLVSGQDM